MNNFVLLRSRVVKHLFRVGEVFEVRLSRFSSSGEFALVNFRCPLLLLRLGNELDLTAGFPLGF